MKTLKVRFVMFFAVLICFAAVFGVSASAAGTVSLNVSPKNAGVGETINVHVEFTSDNMDIQYAEANLEYNSSVMEVASDSQTTGSGGIVRLRGYAADAPSVTFDIKFTALKEGACDLVITNSLATDMNNNSLGSPTANAIVSVGEVSNLDADSTLKTINVSTGTLSPAFNPERTAYTVEVPYETESISIQGQTTNTKSYIYFSGGFDGGLKELDGTSPKIYEGLTSLAVGENVKTITVTAENGEERAYTITVIRLQSGEQTSSVTTTTTPLDTAVPITDEQGQTVSSADGQQTSGDSSNDMNLFVTSSAASQSVTVSPQDDKILNEIFPIIILGIFVVAILLFVIISAIKIHAEKKRREEEERRRMAAKRKRRAAKQMEDYHNRIARQPQNGKPSPSQQTPAANRVSPKKTNSANAAKKPRSNGHSGSGSGDINRPR